MTTIDRRKWFLGATVLEAGHGGIARVARMSARALIESGARIRMVSLLDSKPVEISGERAQTAGGSRLGYAMHCHKAALSDTHFLYDAIGPARAHPRLPGLRRSYGVWIHGIEVWHSLSPDRERALRNASHILVNSRFTLERFRELHGELENAHICWLATEDDKPPNEYRGPDGLPTVLILGRIDNDLGYKGHKELVNCWPEVVSVIPEARLLIAGGGPGLDQLKSLANSSPVRDAIEILGFVSESQLSELWGEALVFAMPSRGEGFGVVYAEAMRHSLPVIASVHDAGQEINVDGVTGFNIDLAKPGGLASRLIELLQNRELACKMGQAGFRHWQENFRFGSFAKRLLEILEMA